MREVRVDELRARSEVSVPHADWPNVFRLRPALLRVEAWLRSDLWCVGSASLHACQQLLEALPEPTSEANKFRFSDVSTDVTLQAPSCHLLVPLARQQAID